MSERELGRSGLKVSPLAFGGNVFGWSVDAATTHALLDECVALGLNLVDTADAYSAWVDGNQGGESETLIGEWLKKSGKRERVVIATKVAKWPQRKGLSPANIQAACEDSLRRLQTDVIDLYQAHEDDASVPLEDTLGAFSRLIEQGKVRAIGASNYTAPRLAEALEVSRRHDLPRYETLQPEYNLVDRSGYESALAPLVREHGLGVIGYYSLASGFLSGKYRSEADAAKSSARGAQVVGKYLNARGKRILAALDDVACRHACKVSQVALAWLIARPDVSAPIVSATSIGQLRELATARTLLLSKADIAALDNASAGG
ncbi:MAG: aldo/keto reductase [Luteimonas sp.]